MKDKTRGMEYTTPTQLIKIAKARHLVGVTIFRCLYVATPTTCIELWLEI